MWEGRVSPSSNWGLRVSLKELMAKSFPRDSEGWLSKPLSHTPPPSGWMKYTLCTSVLIKTELSKTFLNIWAELCPLSQGLAIVCGPVQIIWSSCICLFAMMYTCCNDPKDLSSVSSVISAARGHHLALKGAESEAGLPLGNTSALVPLRTIPGFYLSSKTFKINN